MMSYKSLTAVFAAFALMLLPASAGAQNARMESMKRDIVEQIPERQKQIAEGCEGANPVLEVDFASFGDNYEALENVPYHGLEETTYGVRRFCTNSDRTSETDPVHVGALKKKVRKIVIKFVPKAEQKNISLKAGGVLLIEMAFGVSGGRFDQVEVQQKLIDVL